jgi:hypothetical protein
MSDSNWFDLLNKNTNGYVTTAIDATNDTAYDYNGAPPTSVPDTINAVIATTESKERIKNVVTNASTFNMNEITSSITISSITVYQTVLDNSVEYLANLNILNATTGSGAVVNATINEEYGTIGNISVIESGSISANITASGGGYGRGVPGVYIDPPTNTEATIAKASASIQGGSVSHINVNIPGSGYTEPPEIRIQGPTNINGTPNLDETPASATAVVINGEVVRIDIIVPGSGYTSVPIVFIDLPTRQAKAYCTVDPDHPFGIQAVVLTDPGTGYTQTPKVTIADYNAVYNFTSAIEDISVSNVEITQKISIQAPDNNEASLDAFLFESLIGLNGNVDTSVTTTPGSLYAQLTDPSNPLSFFSQVWKLVDMFQKLFYNDLGTAETYVKQQIESFGSQVNTQVQQILLKKSSLPHTVRTALAQVITNELIAYYLADANEIIEKMDEIMVTIEQLATVADITFSVNKTGTFFMAASDNLYQLTQEFISTYQSIGTGVTTKYFTSSNGRKSLQDSQNDAVAYLKQSTDAYIAAVQGLVNNYKVYIDNAISETLIISNRLKNMHDTHLKDYILTAPIIANFIKRCLSLDQDRIYTLSDDYLKSQTLALYSFGDNRSLLSSSSLNTPPIITCDLGLALFPSYDTLDDADVGSQPAYVGMTSGTSQWVSNIPYILPIFSVMTNTDNQDTLCNTINPITSLVWAQMYFYDPANSHFEEAKGYIDAINLQLDADGLDPFIHDIYPQALVQDTYGIKLTRIMCKIYFTWAVMYQNADELANPGSKDNISQFYLRWANHILNNGSDTDLITALVGSGSDSFSILTNWFQLFNAATTLVDLVVLKYIPQTVPTTGDTSFLENMSSIHTDIQIHGLQHAIDDGNYTYFTLTQTTTAAISYETIQTNVYNIHQGLFMFMTLLMQQSNNNLTKFKSNKSGAKSVPPPPFKVTKKSGIHLNSSKVKTIVDPTPTPSPTPTTKKTQVRVAPDWKRRTIR